MQRHRVLFQERHVHGIEEQSVSLFRLDVRQMIRRTTSGRQLLAIVLVCFLELFCDNASREVSFPTFLDVAQVQQNCADPLHAVTGSEVGLVEVVVVLPVPLHELVPEDLDVFPVDCRDACQDSNALLDGPDSRVLIIERNRWSQNRTDCPSTRAVI